MINTGSIDEKVALYKQKANQIGLEFPVLVKSKIGAKEKYAHYFFCVNNDQGLRDALGFEGYDNCSLLIQAYAPHYEQVYKVYIIKDWFNAEIRLSLPESLLFAADYYAFDSQISFDRKHFKEFDPELDRLNPLVSTFVVNFSNYIGLTFYGIDILVSKKDGRHLVIDCNYLPNYPKVPPEELVTRIDSWLDDVNRPVRNP